MPNVRTENSVSCLFFISQFLLLKGNLPRLMLWSVGCMLRRQRAKPAASFWPAGQSLSILKAEKPEGPDFLAVSGFLGLLVCSCLCPRHCNDLCHRFWLKFGKASLGKDLHSVEMRLQHMLRCLLEQRYICTWWEGGTVHLAKNK